MADFFVWTEQEFGLHVKEMDDEHVNLIQKMNALHKAWEAKAEYTSLLNLVSDLAQYTVKHFKDEEAYMEKIKYEGLTTHKIIHEQLLKQFQQYVDEFKTSKVLTEAFFKFLKVWLSSHIRGIDMKYTKKSAA